MGSFAAIIAFQLYEAFDALTYWKHDDAPTAHDAPARTLEWVKLAQVLHAEHADEAAPPIEHRTSVEAS